MSILEQAYERFVFIARGDGVYFLAHEVASKTLRNPVLALKGWPVPAGFRYSYVIKFYACHHNSEIKVFPSSSLFWE